METQRETAFSFGHWFQGLTVDQQQQIATLVHDCLNGEQTEQAAERTMKALRHPKSEAIELILYAAMAALAVIKKESENSKEWCQIEDSFFKAFRSELSLILSTGAQLESN